MVLFPHARAGHYSAKDSKRIIHRSLGLSLCSSPLFGTLSWELSQTLSSVSSTQRVLQAPSVFPYPEPCLGNSLKTVSWAITRLTSFVSHLSGIAVFHWMMSKVLQSIVLNILCVLFSCFRQESNSVPVTPSCIEAEV